mmetsp:Transcript_80355/g.260328  ORF Transcript_80355/g.260328 Transcript_80355/m.260328 type:complete len:648 (-) Transcript_80355:83-2026(-)
MARLVLAAGLAAAAAASAARGSSRHAALSPVTGLLSEFDESDFDDDASTTSVASAFTAGDETWTKLRVSDNVPAEGCRALAAVTDGQGGLLLQPTGGVAPQPLAWGAFVDSLADVGWSSLSMHTSEAPDAEDGLKMYAAGVVEGYLTAQRIREFHHNSRALVDMNPDNRQRLPKLQQALGRVASELAANARAAGAPGESSFDAQVRLAFMQTWGVRDGYTLAVGRSSSLADAPQLSMVDMFVLNSDGVIDELLSKFGGQEAAPAMLLQQGAQVHKALRGGFPGPQLTRKARRPPAGHCTGLVRLTDDRSELYFGHTTWESFSEMTRVWKVYDFPLTGVAAKKISFSSYPGCVSSTDDYYLMDSGLAVTETTLSIPNQQHYPPTAGVPDFIRIMAANRLATNGEAWVQSMAGSATGTYSSQWMVLNYQKFTPGSEPPDGTFFVLEQAPTANHYEDMTSWLRREGYWASFDRAFFDDVRATTGDSATEAQLRMNHGSEAAIYSKGDTPRAQIVRRTVRDVASLGAMRAEMTRNHGTEEPVDQASLRLPRYTISARSDLRDREHSDPNGSPDGGVDAKVTSSCLFHSLVAEAISSPSHTSLPPFRWTTSEGRELWPGYPHEGLPNAANFGWVKVDPGSPELGSLDDGPCQ